MSIWPAYGEIYYHRNCCGKSTTVNRVMDGLRSDLLAIVRPLRAGHHLMVVLHGLASLELAL